MTVVSRLDPGLADCLPILGAALLSRGPDPALPPADHVDLAGLPLSALLSRVLLSFALEYEHETGLSLAISANVLRILGTDGTRLRRPPPADRNLQGGRQLGGGHPDPGAPSGRGARPGREPGQDRPPHSAGPAGPASLPRVRRHDRAALARALHRRCDRTLSGRRWKRWPPHPTVSRRPCPGTRALPRQLASRGPPPGHPAALPDGPAPGRLPRRPLAPARLPRPSAQAWYRAPNAGIVAGYLAHRDLCGQEHLVERFMDVASSGCCTPTACSPPRAWPWAASLRSAGCSPIPAGAAPTCFCPCTTSSRMDHSEGTIGDSRPEEPDEGHRVRSAREARPARGLTRTQHVVTRHKQCGATVIHPLRQRRRRGARHERDHDSGISPVYLAECTVRNEGRICKCPFGIRSNSGRFSIRIYRSTSPRRGDAPPGHHADPPAREVAGTIGPILDTVARLNERRLRSARSGARGGRGLRGRHRRYRPGPMARRFTRKTNCYRNTGPPRVRATRCGVRYRWLAAISLCSPMPIRVISVTILSTARSARC